MVGFRYFTPSMQGLRILEMSPFFVLSGFVIQYNYAGIFREERLSFAIRTFLVARFARLYPLYALSIILWPKPHLADYKGTVLA